MFLADHMDVFCLCHIRGSNVPPCHLQIVMSQSMKSVLKAVRKGKPLSRLVY